MASLYRASPKRLSCALALRYSMMAASYFCWAMYASPLATYFRLSVSGSCLHDTASAARTRMLLRKDRAVRSMVMDAFLEGLLVAGGGLSKSCVLRTPAGEVTQALGISRAARG